MADIPLKAPLVNNETEEYEEPIRPHQDGLAARGFYPQDPSIETAPDSAVGVERDALNNLWLRDGYGSATLTTLRAGSGSQASDVDFLLENEPPSPTNLYANTRAGGRVVRETWTNRGTDMLIKSIDYTRVAGKVATEVRKVFGPDGVTVRGQLTVEYSRIGGKVAAATETRDI
jgi:hypothetical protein